MGAFTIKFGLQEMMEMFGGGKTKATTKFKEWVRKSGKKKDDFNLDDVQKITGIPFANLLLALNADHPKVKNLLDKTDDIDEKVKILREINLNAIPKTGSIIGSTEEGIPLQKKSIPYAKKEKQVKEVDSEKQKRMDAKYHDGKYFERKEKERNRKRKEK